MNKLRSFDPTLEYYRENAGSFASDTLNVDMRNIYGEFLPLVRPGGQILNAGCGTGRDSAYFKQRGFTITAFDASREMARIAEKVVGQPISLLTFAEVEFQEQFDGVWACASLLHLPSNAVDEAVSRLARSLKVGGVFYLSFKYGQLEGLRGGRFFNDYDETKIASLLAKHEDLRIEKHWKSPDTRKGRESQWWLNAILRRN